MATRVFFEHDSMAARQLLAFLERQGSTCEVLLASDPFQGAVLASNLSAAILVIQGGLTDGRADTLLEHLDRAKKTSQYEWIIFLDRRQGAHALPESTLEAAEKQLAASLSGGWLLLKFLEPRK